MTLEQPRPPGQVEKSPGSALAILLGLAFAAGLALFALARKPAPPLPVQAPAGPNPQVIETKIDPAQPVSPFPPTPTVPPPPPPPAVELVGEQSTDQPQLVPVAKTAPAPPEPK
ncbi:MAG: hypothetical protein L6R28_17500 [Planctomycetes bacterium]|nr:hypothetical protein [Planctomycetota bacterium]